MNDANVNIRPTLIYTNEARTVGTSRDCVGACAPMLQLQCTTFCTDYLPLVQYANTTALVTSTYLPTIRTYSTHNILPDRYFMNIAWIAAFPLFYYTHFSEIEK